MIRPVAVREVGARGFFTHAIMRVKMKVTLLYSFILELVHL